MAGIRFPMARLRPKNLDKVFWPADGLTKGDLLRYFEAMAPALLPVLRDRPLSVKRCPNGIEATRFFQKNTPAYAPPWVPTRGIWAPSARREVRYALCNSEDVLLWLADQAAIELHPWLSRVDRLEEPDLMAFDLDPPEGAFARAASLALVLRDVLQEAGLRSVAKTSGAKGVHVVVPLRRGPSFQAVREVAAALGRLLEQRVPDLATTAVRRVRRGGRVFVDVGRNAAGQHMVAVYSPRARPGATVSFPVPWDELGTVRPEHYTLRTVPAILEREGDRWRALRPRPQALPRSLPSA
jgi:bifunctional non-homologous end joining protein LigD